MPHNDICNDPDIKEVFEDFINEHPSYLKEITINKEPDYMFVVDRSR